MLYEASAEVSQVQAVNGRLGYICTTLRGWIKGTAQSLYTANHKEYLQVPIRVVRRHRLSSN